MSTGSPIVFDDSPNRQFRSLTAVSTNKDDPNRFSETLLQELICETPEVLPVHEFLGARSALFHLGREVPVDIGNSGGDGSIDNLLVTSEGYIVIVETKLFRNPDARKVVTQTLQYGMAVSSMPLLELEARIRRGQNPGLEHNEGIRDCVSRLAIKKQVQSLADDFEDTLSRHLRRREVLLLVVSDSIRIGVGRLTDWLNEQGNSSAFTFGLVELKFYVIGNQRLVIPRTVLKTQEVSRHVVMVDIQPRAADTVTAGITDDFQSATGAKRQESRSIAIAPVLLTKGMFLQIVHPEDHQAASRLIEQFEILKFEPQGTPTTLKYGFRSDDGEFHSLVALDKAGAWIGPLKKDAERLGVDVMLDFRKEANRFAHFYDDEQLTHLIGFGHVGRYGQLEEKAAAFAAFLDVYRTRIMEHMEQAD